MLDHQQPKRHSDVLIAAMALLITLLMPFASDGYTPSMPAIAKYFNISANTTQLTISLYLLGATFSQLFYGPLSDRFGRRSSILLGIILCLFGSILCAVSVSPIMLIMARAIQGMGAGASNVMFRAIMRDTFTGIRMAKIASYTGMVFTLMLAAAPIIGGYIQEHFGWRENFLSVGLLCAFILPIIFFILPETNVNRNKLATHPKIFINNYLTLLKSADFMGYTLCSSIAFSGMIAYYTISPFLFQDILGLTPAQYGWLSLALAFGLMCGQYTNSHLVSLFGHKKMLKYGIYLMMFSGLLLIILNLDGKVSILSILLATLIFTISGGLVFSNSMVGAFHRFPHMAGTAGALYGSIQVLGSFIVSFLITQLPQENTHILGFVYFLLGLMAYCILYTLLKNAPNNLD